MESFTVEHLLRIRRPTWVVPMHVSPDGALLSLTVQSPARFNGPYQNGFDQDRVPLLVAGSHVWVIDTETGVINEPFSVESTSWAGRWSPDGSRLAAYVQYQGGTCLGIWSRDTCDVRFLREAPVWAFFGFEVPQWTPDGRSILAKLKSRGLRGESAVDKCPAAAVEVYSYEPGMVYNPAPPEATAETRGVGELGRVDALTGAVQRLATPMSFCGWRLSPDGKTAAVLPQTGRDEPRGQNYYDLLLVPLNGAESTILARNIPQNLGISLAWSPDSRYLAYAAAERGQTGRIEVVRADGSASPRLVSGGDDIRVGDYDLLRWSGDGRFVYALAGPRAWELAADGSTRREIRLVFDCAEAEHRVQFWVQRPLQGTVWPLEQTVPVITQRSESDDQPWLARVDLQNGKTTLLRPWMRTEASCGYGMEGTPDGSAYFLITESCQRGFELWRLSQSDQPATPLRSFNPELEQVELGERRLISWSDPAEEERQGALLLPPGYTKGRRVPLIVNVYGGEENSRAIHHFGFGGYSFDSADLLAAQGYAVFHPDMPLEGHDPLRELPALVKAAVRQVVRSGIADPARIGIIGHSYGGYCVLALLGQTRLFRAAVCSAGIVDLISFYSSFWNGLNFNWSWAERGQGRMGGTPWEKRNGYIRNSPFYFLDRVTAPVLLVAGTDVDEDARQAKQAFGALRRLDRTVELRLYPGEGHTLSTWSADSMRDLASRVLTWFARHL